MGPNFEPPDSEAGTRDFRGMPSPSAAPDASSRPEPPRAASQLPQPPLAVQSRQQPDAYPEASAAAKSSSAPEPSPLPPSNSQRQAPPASAPAAAPPMPTGAAQWQGDEKAAEQMWVERARSVLMRTAGDPYAQHEMVQKLRAQYLHERIAMDIYAPKDGSKTA